MRLVILIVLACLAPRPALAYLDPSTGSMIISAIVGLFASVALAVKTYWYRIKSVFRGKSTSGETAPDESRKQDSQGQ